MIVLDASAAIEWLLQSDKGMQVDSLMAANGDDLHAPHLFDLEIAQVLRRLVMAGKVSAAHGGEAIEVVGHLSCERYPHELLLSRVWQLRENFTAYDAAYIALAETLGATLVTCDAKLVSPAHRARVQLVA